jgi:hypothetical protein
MNFMEKILIARQKRRIRDGTDRDVSANMRESDLNVRRV